MFVTQPSLRRTLPIALDIESTVEGEQGDYSSTQYGVELPFGKANLQADRKIVVRNAKPGQVLALHAKVSVAVRNRFVTAEVHGKLYSHGRPTFKRTYVHGDTIVQPVWWECYDALDLEKLPFLFQLYIHEQHLRSTK